MIVKVTGVMVVIVTVTERVVEGVVGGTVVAPGGVIEHVAVEAEIKQLSIFRQLARLFLKVICHSTTFIYRYVSFSVYIRCLTRTNYYLVKDIVDVLRKSSSL